jgi:hypothetical protein
MSEEKIARREVPMDDAGKMDIVRFAQAIAADPEIKRWRSPGAVLLAMRAGEEMGMTITASLNNLYVVGGTVAIEGCARRGIIQKADILKKGTALDLFWMIDGEAHNASDWSTIALLVGQMATPVEQWPDDFAAIIIGQRADWNEARSRFYSVADAKAANLWAKRGKYGDSAWVTNPLDMLEWRATSRWCKRYAADLTVGVVPSIEEVRDLGQIEATTKPARQLAPPDEPDPILEAAGIEAVAAEVVADDPDAPRCPACDGTHKPSEPCPQGGLFGGDE